MFCYKKRDKTARLKNQPKNTSKLLQRARLQDKTTKPTTKNRNLQNISRSKKKCRESKMEERNRTHCENCV